MKVVIQTIVPSPYRVLFFNELGKLCDLTVIYEGKRPDNGRVYNWLSIKLSYKEPARFVFLPPYIIFAETARKMEKQNQYANY